jgi:hypothetical protein
MSYYCSEAVRVHQRVLVYARERVCNDSSSSDRPDGIMNGHFYERQRYRQPEE